MGAHPKHPGLSPMNCCAPSMKTWAQGIYKPKTDKWKSASLKTTIMAH